MPVARRSRENAVTRGVLGLIRVYRYLVSPFFPGCCRYSPSCSRYAIEAIEGVGLMRGLWLSVKRIARCHPFAEGGVDPAPRKMPS